METPNKRYIKRYLPATILIIVISTIILSIYLNKTEEPQKTAELEQLSNQEQVETSAEIEEPISFRKFDEKTVDITKYELFYRDDFMYSKDAVEFFSLTNTIQKYALFHHLEQHDYKWDDETRAKFRERIIMALEYDKKNPDYVTYLEKMFEELQITEDDYIDYYLLVNKEYDMLYQDQFNIGIGLNDGGYPSGDSEMAYKKLIGISEDELNEMAELFPNPLQPMEQQPDLPCLREDSYLKVTTNEEVEYIFVDAMYSLTELDDPHRYLLYELERDVVKEEISRISLKKYKEAVASYESNDAEEVETAKEFGLFLEILERSLEMELY